MNEADPFAPVADDSGPAELVDMLLGLHAALSRARAGVEVMTRGAEPTEGENSPFVEVLLGLVSLAGTIQQMLPDEPSGAAGAATAGGRHPREDLLR